MTLYDFANQPKQAFQASMYEGGGECHPGGTPLSYIGQITDKDFEIVNLANEPGGWKYRSFCKISTLRLGENHLLTIH